MKIFILFFIGFISRILIYFFFNVNVLVEFLDPVSITYYSFMAFITVFINEFFSFFNLSILANFWNLPGFYFLFANKKKFKLEYLKISSIRSLFKNLSLDQQKETLGDSFYNSEISDTSKENNDIFFKKGESSKSSGSSKDVKGKGKAISYDNYTSRGTDAATASDIDFNTNKKERDVKDKGKGKEIIKYNEVEDYRGGENSHGSTSKNKYIAYRPNAYQYQSFISQYKPNPLAVNELDSKPLVNELDSNSLYELDSKQVSSYSYQVDNTIYSSDNKYYPSVGPSVNYDNKPSLQDFIQNRNNVDKQYVSPDTRYVCSPVSPVSPISNVLENTRYVSTPVNGSPVSSTSNFTNDTTHATVGKKDSDYNVDNNLIPITGRDYSIPSALSYSSKEVAMNIRSKGDVKLGFYYSHDENKSNLEKIYLKYKNISKRKFFWYLWEKDRGNFDSYADFKRAWDPNTKVMKEIKKEVKSDLSKEIHNLISRENPWNKESIVDSSVRRRVDQQYRK